MKQKPENDEQITKAENRDKHHASRSRIRKSGTWNNERKYEKHKLHNYLEFKTKNMTWLRSSKRHEKEKNEQTGESR